MIHFDDGAAYEHMMGIWSQLAGDQFLRWLSPEPGLRWIDVGCGNGAFSQLLARRCAPSWILGIDPSENQLAFARARLSRKLTEFRVGNAMALPAEDRGFDAAVMALAIFFVPEPAQGVAEMMRVVKPGGIVGAYAWDVLRPGDFPMEPMKDELLAMGLQPILPPRSDVSRSEMLSALWTDAGLTEVAQREIVVQRTFEDFADFWRCVEITIYMDNAAHGMSAEIETELKKRLQARFSVEGAGSISYPARANAICGQVPA